MKRREADNFDAGSDSFMDIVSNVVGIVIVLVMVTGARVRNAASAARDDSAAAAVKAANESAQEVPRLQSQASQVVSQVKDVTRTLAEMQQRLFTARHEREQLGALVRTVELELDSERTRMDAGQQQALDLARQLASARARRDELHGRQASLLTQSAPEVKQVVSYPTPIGKAVETHEEHFRLRGRRLVRVPLEELKDLLHAEHRQFRWQLRDVPEVTGTLGPLDGFKLNYRVVRTATAGELDEATIVPMAADLGEPLATALASGSAFRQRLQSLDRVTTTITVWTYPDSFDDFRTLKKELYQLGFAVAARPMDQDGIIGMSPRGSKSVAE